MTLKTIVQGHITIKTLKNNWKFQLQNQLTWLKGVFIIIFNTSILWAETGASVLGKSFFSEYKIPFTWQTKHTNKISNKWARQRGKDRGTEILAKPHVSVIRIISDLRSRYSLHQLIKHIISQPKISILPRILFTYQMLSPYAPHSLFLYQTCYNL